MVVKREKNQDANRMTGKGKEAGRKREKYRLHRHLHDSHGRETSSGASNAISAVIA